MEEHGMYLGKKEFYELIRKNGGTSSLLGHLVVRLVVA